MKKFEKLITFTVPCYNSEAYMRHCIDSILVGGDDVEILIVDDGSTKDRTGEIADEYEKKYPNICKAIHQENGGHGAGVNQGIKNAKGKYFKVVDSDDWVDEDAYKKILKQLHQFEKDRTDIDLMIANYVYEKVNTGEQRIIDFSKGLPQYKVFGWEEMGKFGPNEFFVMHTLIYKTQILWDSRVVLPEHTFYVDSIFATMPLPYVKKIYYMNVNFYRYFVGRDDQSVNAKMLLKRIDQYMYVTQLICEQFDHKKTVEISPKLAEYIFRLIRILSLISTVHLRISGTPENEQKRKDFWKMVKKNQPELYPRIRTYWGCQLANYKGHTGRFVAVRGYKIANKIFKFN
jgi:glycosyltransferase involved in cell wall biosynthesis